MVVTLNQPTFHTRMLTEPGVLADPVPSEPGSDFTFVRTVKLPRGWVKPDPEVAQEP